MSPPRFFESLNYTSVNEDWRTEAEALQLGSRDLVLCVTGSGDRPLNLLALDPDSVVAIDRNPAQNRLLLLKMAAMRRLPFEAYATFLGLLSPGESPEPSPPDGRTTPAAQLPALVTHRRTLGQWRDHVWQKLRPDLPPDARRFWDGHRSRLRAGILYQGRWERYYRRVARIVRIVRPRVVPRLFSFRDLDEQRAFVRERWDTPAWRAMFLAVCCPLASRVLLRDPAYYAHAAVPPGPVLYARMLRSLDRVLARENFMVSLVLRGRLPATALPPHLTAAGYELIRPRLDRLQMVTDDVLLHLKALPEPTYTAYSLSDVPSFLAPDQFEDLLEGVVRSASPMARMVVRQFLTRYPVPDHLADRLPRRTTLEARLALEDRSFAYEFMVADVQGKAS